MSQIVVRQVSEIQVLACVAKDRLERTSWQDFIIGLRIRAFPFYPLKQFAQLPEQGYFIWAIFRRPEIELAICVRIAFHILPTNISSGFDAAAAEQQEIEEPTAQHARQIPASGGKPRCAIGPLEGVAGKLFSSLL